MIQMPDSPLDYQLFLQIRPFLLNVVERLELHFIFDFENSDKEVFYRLIYDDLKSNVNSVSYCFKIAVLKQTFSIILTCFFYKIISITRFCNYIKYYYFNFFFVMHYLLTKLI